MMASLAFELWVFVRVGVRHNDVRMSRSSFRNENILAACYEGRKPARRVQACVMLLLLLPLHSILRSGGAV